MLDLLLYLIVDLVLVMLTVYLLCIAVLVACLFGILVIDLMLIVLRFYIILDLLDSLFNIVLEIAHDGAGRLRLSDRISFSCKKDDCENGEPCDRYPRIVFHRLYGTTQILRPSVRQPLCGRRRVAKLRTRQIVTASVRRRINRIGGLLAQPEHEHILHNIKLLRERFAGEMREAA